MNKPVQKIALTGFMGSGKSTTGRLLAQKLGLAFIDTDQEIERVYAQSASSLFKAIAEAAFRAAEAQILVKCLELPNTVVALGGAAIDLLESRNYLQSGYTGLLIFLDGDFEVLIGRCLTEAEGTSTYRPLLHQREKALAKFRLRRDWNLAIADLTVKVNGKTCEEVAAEIVELTSA